MSGMHTFGVTIYVDHVMTAWSFIRYGDGYDELIELPEEGNHCQEFLWELMNSHVGNSVVAKICGLRLPSPPAAPGGLRPQTTLPQRRGNMTPTGHDTCTMAMVRACTLTIVHASTMAILHACTFSLACIIAIVHACTMDMVHISSP